MAAAVRTDSGHGLNPGRPRRDHDVPQPPPRNGQLTPHVGPVPEDIGAPSLIPLPPPGLDGAIWLAERYRVKPDSPAGTLCRPAWVTPATWHIVLPGGLAFTVPNADPGGPDPIVPSGGLVTCQRHLDDATLIYYGQPLS